MDIIAKYAECIITYLNRWICARGRGWETLSPARKVTQPPLHENSSSACVKIFAAHNINNITKTLPKAQRTQGLSSAYQSYLFRSYHKMNTQILIKFYLRNLDQASNSKSQPNISISTKLKIQNLVQT